MAVVSIGGGQRASGGTHEAPVPTLLLLEGVVEGVADGGGGVETTAELVIGWVLLIIE